MQDYVGGQRPPGSFPDSYSHSAVIHFQIKPQTSEWWTVAWGELKSEDTSRDFYALLVTVEPDCINITISNQSDPSVVTGFLDIKQHKINPAVLILAKGQSQIFRSP